MSPNMGRKRGLESSESDSHRDTHRQSKWPRRSSTSHDRDHVRSSSIQQRSEEQVQRLRVEKKETPRGSAPIIPAGNMVVTPSSGLTREREPRPSNHQRSTSRSSPSSVHTNQPRTSSRERGRPLVKGSSFRRQPSPVLSAQRSMSPSNNLHSRPSNYQRSTPHSTPSSGHTNRSRSSSRDRGRPLLKGSSFRREPSPNSDERDWLIRVPSKVVTTKNERLAVRPNKYKHLTSHSSPSSGHTNGSSPELRERGRSQYRESSSRRKSSVFFANSTYTSSTPENTDIEEERKNPKRNWIETPVGQLLPSSSIPVPRSPRVKSVIFVVTPNRIATPEDEAEPKSFQRRRKNARRRPPSPDSSDQEDIYGTLDCSSEEERDLLKNKTLLGRVEDLAAVVLRRTLERKKGWKRRSIYDVKPNLKKLEAWIKKRRYNRGWHLPLKAIKWIYKFRNVLAHKDLLEMDSETIEIYLSCLITLAEDSRLFNNNQLASLCYEALHSLDLSFRPTLNYFY